VEKLRPSTTTFLTVSVPIKEKALSG